MVVSVLDQEQQLRVDKLNREARATWHSDVVQARALAEEAHQLAGAYEKGWMDSLVMLAQCGLKLGLYEEAITNVNRALDYYQQHDFFDEWQLNAHFTLGAANTAVGNHTEALSAYQKLINFAETMQETAYIALGLRNLGNLYGHQGDFETAIYFYDQAVPHFEQQSTRSGLASVYGNYCWIYQQQEKLDLALEYVLRSRKLYEEAENRDGQALTSIHIADLYMRQGKFEPAEQHLTAALDIARELGIGSYIADGLLNLGRLHVLRGDYALASEYTHQGLAHAETIQHKTIQMYCHLLLHDCYKRLENWQTALHHHEVYTALKDEMRSQENATKLRNLEVLHRTRQAQSEAEAQRKLREEDRRYYEQINQMKDEILNTASHDLKSPLVGIKHTVDSLRRHGRLDDARGLQLMADIDQTIRQMGTLITSVLDLAKLETGRALHIEPQDFSSLLVEVLKDTEQFAQQRQINITVARNDSISLPFDRQRLHQVLHNLIMNAIKYTNENGQISIISKTEDDKLMVTITDSGIGIPAHALPYVFERFYRVPDEPHQQIEGTGLGLAIVKAIIEQHDGSIWVESVPGQGSTFSFSLPLTPARLPD